MKKFYILLALFIIAGVSSSCAQRDYLVDRNGAFNSYPYFGHYSVYRFGSEVFYIPYYNQYYYNPYYNNFYYYDSYYYDGYPYSYDRYNYIPSSSSVKKKPPRDKQSYSHRPKPSDKQSSRDKSSSHKSSRPHRRTSSSSKSSTSRPSSPSVLSPPVSSRGDAGLSPEPK